LGFLALAFVSAAVVSTSAWAQDGLPEGKAPTQTDTDRPSPAASTNKWTRSTEPLTQQQTQDAKLWLTNLTSREFAVRERAAENLLGLGEAVVPLMRERLSQISHPEAKLRLNNLVTQLNQGNLDQRLEAFARGEDVGFEGWRIFRIMFGPSGASRDLFIELKVNYPSLVDAFHGTPRDLAMAMDDVTKAISEKRKRLPAPLTVADAVALLLPVGDERVPMGEGYEDDMIRVLQVAPASQAHKDPLLGRAYANLLNAWIRRSTLGNRARVLNFAIQGKFLGGYSLAKRTLTEAKDPETIAMAMQLISVMGRKADSRLFVEFLDDKRKLTSILSGEGKLDHIVMADAAIAAVAKLHGMSLMELGHPRTSEHVNYGFIYEQLTYRQFDQAQFGGLADELEKQPQPEGENSKPEPFSMAKAREKAKQRIQRLLEESGLLEPKEAAPNRRIKS
jgi:hypothetical protein